MASIYIREVDGTIFGLSTTSADNVVFVPGTATTGPSTPTLCQSYKEFTNVFGDTSPEGSNGTFGTNWEYAANVLLAGFPVLFRRITDDKDGNSLVTKATAEITWYDTSTGTTYTIGHVTDLYGGTFGNRLSYSIVVNDLSIYFRVSQKYTIGTTSYTKQIESIKLIDKSASDTDEDIRQKLLARIGTKLDTEYVRITVDNADAGEHFFITSDILDTPLAGGTDADEYKAAAAAASVFSEIADKMIYDVKFITAGGYYNFDYTEEGSPSSTTIDFASKMAELADTRQDCIAILDIPYSLPKTDVRTYFTNVVNINTSYAAAYAPWAYMTLESGNTGLTKWMPPSYVFIHTLARSIKSGNKIWFPPAGVRRATVGEIVETQYDVGTALLDEWQNNSPQYINPIMKLRQYGFVIYGQRTLYRSVDGSVDNRSALQELGVRITANEIKRRINSIALSLTFEQNNIHTWNEFRGTLDPFLSQMKSDGALYDYEIIMDETTTTNADIDENRIVGVVRANITRAAEDFEIGFELTASSVSFSES